MKIESDILKTAAVVVILVGVYGGVVFWPSQKQNKAMADELATKQEQLNAMAQPDLAPLREQITQLRAEMRERSVTLPVGDLHDRVLHHVSDTLLDRSVTQYETAYRATEHYKRFSVTPIDVEFETRFNNAFKILRRIENQGPPVRVESLRLSADADEPTSQVEVEMLLSSFYLPTEQGGGR